MLDYSYGEKHSEYKDSAKYPRPIKNKGGETKINYFGSCRTVVKVIMITKASDLENIEVIETGTLVDKLSGVGGIPRGVITEVWGDSGIGKSSLALQAVARGQHSGMKCLYIDVEWAVSPIYAQKLGVDISKLDILREKCAEDILDATVDAADKYDFIVLDSIGALTPRAEIEKGNDGKVIGGQAGLLARFCRKIVPVLHMNNVALLLINHSFVDIMSGALKTSGGKKLEYAKSLSIRLKVDTTKSVKRGEEKVGKVIIGEVKKNKLAGNEGQKESSTFLFNEGYSQSADLFQEALDKGLIKRTGNTLFFNEIKLGTINKARETIKNNEELQKKISSLLKV